MTETLAVDDLIFEVRRSTRPTRVTRGSPRVTTSRASGSHWSTYMVRNFQTRMGRLLKQPP